MKISFSFVNEFLLVAEKLDGNLTGIVKKSALNVEARCKVLIQAGEKSGLVTKVAGKEHQASAPGEAPATDLGNLVNSIGPVRMVGKFAAEVPVSAEYANDLEYGTSKMAARPFMEPALQAEKVILEKAAKELFKL